jgi:hypothetical protein
MFKSYLGFTQGHYFWASLYNKDTLCNKIIDTKIKHLTFHNNVKENKEQNRGSNKHEKSMINHDLNKIYSKTTK